MSVIENLKPKLVWKHFDEIRKIPHCSKHEEKIRECVLDFAKQHNIKSKTDKAGNVVLLKPASQGMEGKPTVILQGHMDMVCEKNSDVEFDFEKDPIQVWIDDGWVKAKGTTLGADDGIGIAALLALLASKDIAHGPIECLFTIDEETGMTGVNALTSEFVEGR
ncbi:MAG: M20/M25/M40 family metallo-hydrolase, partial [Thermoplasmatales archaeon]|nr:M20/M25/M40 family metallo-hydrolase [Thermoplasmatales archaeon]